MFRFSMVDLVDPVICRMVHQNQLPSSQLKEERKLTYRLRALRFAILSLYFTIP